MRRYTPAEAVERKHAAEVAMIEVLRELFDACVEAHRLGQITIDPLKQAGDILKAAALGVLTSKPEVRS